jgi:hypothetical protein
MCKTSVIAIIEELGCSKVYAHWVQQILTVAHKKTKKEIATDLFPTSTTLEVRTPISHCQGVWGNLGPTF